MLHFLKIQDFTIINISSPIFQAFGTTRPGIEPSLPDCWRTLPTWPMSLPMVRETWVQSQVASYQKTLKWYLMLPRLTLSNRRYVSRVKWSNPRKGVVPSLTPCNSY